uniref:Uncharacterized protein n=1 Tax=Setaria viridis TaxID=4556 RepID=A0A4U6UCU5_SETVI|nr:hypothetical protein SEVIR_5G070700v2 [Setaria viridis]TKW12982.1 hypothetical protein SEVIR_5G070700v2 [Setaria viridis]
MPPTDIPFDLSTPTNTHTFKLYRPDPLSYFSLKSNRQYYLDHPRTPSPPPTRACPSRTRARPRPDALLGPSRPRLLGSSPAGVASSPLLAPPHLHSAASKSRRATVVMIQARWSTRRAPACAAPPPSPSCRRDRVPLLELLLMLYFSRAPSRPCWAAADDAIGQMSS